MQAEVFQPEHHDHENIMIIIERCPGWGQVLTWRLNVEYIFVYTDTMCL